MRTRFTLLVLLVAAFAVPALAKDPQRHFKNRVLTSTALPKIAVRIDPAFEYVGRHPIRIDDIAAGERFVFVDTEGKRVKRLLIFQFEGFLPTSDEIYRYDFSNAETLGGHKFRHGLHYFSNDKVRSEEPKKEAAATHAFLTGRRYVLDDELMMSRFLTLGDDTRKHEMIIFYMENVKDSGHTIAEFAAEGGADLWKKISGSLNERSRKAFKVLR